MTHPVPPEALGKHLAILGKTGSGKSNLAKTIAEDLLARGERVCVIDPTGTWWGLRLQADGETPSAYPIVIFGGQHGDLPLSAAHGEHIARAIGTSSTPAIIDTRQLTVSDRTRFFTGFAETLIQANRGELTLIVDEAHLFAPQAGARGGGAAPAMLHAANNLVSLGRGVGLRIVLISQRPAKLHKDSLTQVETLVAMRLIAPQDRRAIDDWIGEWADKHESGDLVGSLPALPVGDAWVWSPEIGHLKRAHCPLASTYDSGRVRDGENPDLPPIELSEIAGQLEKIGGDLLADDPKRLKERIRELERELKKKPAAVDEAEIERRVTQEVTAKYNSKYSRAREEVADLSTEVHAIAARLDELGRMLRELPAPEASAPKRSESANRASDMQNLSRPAGSPREGASNGREAPSNGREAPSSRRQPGTDRPLTGPQCRILDALAWLAELGVAARASRVQVAFIAGYKPGGGSFNNTLGSLRTAGLVEYPGSGLVELTADGRRLAQDPDIPHTDEALQRAVLEKLTGPQCRVLQPLIDAYPDELDREALATAAGYEAGGGSFNNTVGSLRSLGLIDYPRRGWAVALPVLFVGISE